MCSSDLAAPRAVVLGQLQRSSQQAVKAGRRVGARGAPRESAIQGSRADGCSVHGDSDELVAGVPAEVRSLREVLAKQPVGFSLGLIDHEVVVIPKSASPERIASIFTSSVSPSTTGAHQIDGLSGDVCGDTAKP